MRSSPPQGNDGSEEEDEATEAAEGTTLRVNEGKPLFLEDEDETMRSEDEVMGVAGSADMRTGATAVPERQRACCFISNVTSLAVISLTKLGGVN